MLHLLAAVLVFCVALPLGAWDGQMALFESDRDHRPQRLLGQTTAGVRFTTPREFHRVWVCCPSYGNDKGSLTATLYPWKGTVEASRAAGAVATKRFVDFADNENLGLEFPTRSAGNYYLELSEGTEMVGVWKEKSGRSDVQSFLDGRPVEGVYRVSVDLTGLEIPFSGDWDVYQRLVAPTLAPAETTGVSDEKGQLVPDRDFCVRDLWSDTWDAIDGLERPLGTALDCPAPRVRQVGLFYWTWHEGFHAADRCAVNNAELLAGDPTLIDRPDDPAWGRPWYRRHHWDKPLLDYYRTTDAWVSRHHAAWLAAAGVDAVVFDATNGDLTWMDSTWTLARTWSALRREGLKTPKFAYMLPFGDTPIQVKSLLQLYRDLYRPGLYRDLWYYWKGRPLIHANPAVLGRTLKNPALSAADREDVEAILRFFTFRPLQPGYATGPAAPDQWCWLEVYPQHGYMKQANGRFEMCAAGVAQNHSWLKLDGGRGLAAMNDINVFGRAYRGPDEAHLAPGQRLRFAPDCNPHRGDPNRFLHGDNFAQQLDHARSLDPDYLFVTGWNEGVAAHFPSWMGKKGAFPDQYSPAFSRDIEPSAGVLKDHFYYQFVDGIRRYRGVRRQRRASEQPVYRDVKGDTHPRNAKGYGDLHLTETSGRNDIVECAVEQTPTTLVFRATCAAPLTPCTDPAWMRLFVSTRYVPNDAHPHWNHFQYVVNRLSPPDAQTAVLERSIGGWNWEKVASVRMEVSSETLLLEIPRKHLNLGAKVDIRFKWADNTSGPSEDGDILDFYLHGDAAPDGRFVYRYFD